MKNDADGHSLEWESPAAQALQRVLLSDNNKYVHAFAHEAVRRLSTSVPTPVKASLFKTRHSSYYASNNYSVKKYGPTSKY